MSFTQGFDSYVCIGDSITCTVEGYTIRAHIERDDDSAPPDERSDGFWPSLDPESAGFIGNKSDRTLRRETAWAKHVLDAWKNDDWFYCGVCLTVSRNGVELVGPYGHALWGIECNYPAKTKSDKPNDYLRDVANENLPEALAAAKAKMRELFSDLVGP
jgi:hypothetical protein